jgi:MATE family multidrug resistance protein
MLDLRYKTILSVALPLMGSTFIQSIVLLTDASFLSRYSTQAFDAVGNGGLIYVTVFMALVGISDGSQILQARRIGQNNWKALARILGTTFLSNMLLAIGLIVLLQSFMGAALNSYSSDLSLAKAQTEYIEIRSWALLFAAITLSINAFFFAVGSTWKVLVCSVITALSNIFLDYSMIFGHFGFDEMGLKGAALASTASDGIGMLTSFGFLFFAKERKEHALLRQLNYNWESMKELFKIGSPIMLQGLLALSTWTLFFTWIEQKGSYELTVSQNIRAIYFLAFVPLFGFAGTTKTYISQYIGKKNWEDIPKIQKRIQWMTLIFLLIVFHGAILYPETLIGFINPQEEYLKDSARIMRMVSGSILLYGFASVYFQSINGSGNTRITLYIEIIAVALYLISAYLFIKVWDLDIYYVWFVEYIYFGSMGLLSYIYLKTSNWKHKTI